MKKIKNSNFFKIAIIFLISCLFIIFMNNYVMADSLGLNKDLGKYAQEQSVSKKLTDKVSVILGVVQIVGSLFSVICLIILGVKYMMGSVEEKAEYKKTLVPYTIGAFMVLGISNLLNVVYQIATNIF